MIYESSPWRDLLKKDAGIIHRWAAKHSFSERRSFLIEKKVFLAAYAIRKLTEAKKLSSSFDDKNLRCDAFPALKGKILTRWNNHQIEKLFDLSKPSKKNLSVLDLLDLVVHSLVFNEVVHEDLTIEGFYVTSERKRENLWFVKFTDFTSIMRYVAQDRPAAIIRVPDDKNDSWIEWRGKGKPPAHLEKKLLDARKRLSNAKPK